MWNPCDLAFTYTFIGTMYVYSPLYVYLCVNIYICIYVFIYTCPQKKFTIQYLYLLCTMYSDIFPYYPILLHPLFKNVVHKLVK